MPWPAIIRTRKILLSFFTTLFAEFEIHPGSEAKSLLEPTSHGQSISSAHTGPGRRERLEGAYVPKPHSY